MYMSNVKTKYSRPDKCKTTWIGGDRYDWTYCPLCDGRVHEEECKTKKVKGKDCLDDHTEEEYIKAGY
jgi:hypothetical protein